MLLGLFPRGRQSKPLLTALHCCLLEYFYASHYFIQVGRLIGAHSSVVVKALCMFENLVARDHLGDQGLDRGIAV
jgi:hypothetical protein